MPADIPDLNTPGVPGVGSLLVATPEISEGVFRRAVILLLDHDESGSLGVILNQLTDLSAAAVMPGWESVLYSTVAAGGPVGPDSAIAVARLLEPMPPVEGSGLRQVAWPWAMVDLDGDPAKLAEVAGAQLFAGYSGWGPEQLEGELRSGAWWVVDSHPADLALARQSERVSMWRTVLRRQAGDLRFAATYPDDPSHN